MREKVTGGKQRKEKKRKEKKRVADILKWVRGKKNELEELLGERGRLVSGGERERRSRG